MLLNRFRVCWMSFEDFCLLFFWDLRDIDASITPRYLIKKQYYDPPYSLSSLRKNTYFYGRWTKNYALLCSIHLSLLLFIFFFFFLMFIDMKTYTDSPTHNEIDVCLPVNHSIMHSTYFAPNEILEPVELGFDASLDFHHYSFVVRPSFFCRLLFSIHVVRLASVSFFQIPCDLPSFLVPFVSHPCL